MQTKSQENEMLAMKRFFLVLGTYMFFFLPFILKKNQQEFYRYHMNQSFGFFLTVFAILILREMPFIDLLVPFLLLIVAGLWILAVYNAFLEKQEPIPFLGLWFERLGF